MPFYHPSRSRMRAQTCPCLRMDFSPNPADNTLYRGDCIVWSFPDKRAWSSMSWYSDKEKGRQNSWRITVPDDIVHREAYRTGMNEAADERRRQDKARLDVAFSGNPNSYSGTTAGK